MSGAPHRSLMEKMGQYSQRNPNTGCVLWTAYVNSGGYGTVRNGKTMSYAHRVSYEFAKGPIPEGLDLDHLCKVRNCINPDHLEAVTRKENIGRNAQALKQVCIRGHRLEGYNLITKYGQRMCRLCRKIRLVEFRKREKANAQGN